MTSESRTDSANPHAVGTRFVTKPEARRITATLSHEDWLPFEVNASVGSELLSISGMALTFNLLPAMFPYPVIHVMADVFVVGALCSYCAGAWLVVAVVAHLWRRSRVDAE